MLLINFYLLFSHVPPDECHRKKNFKLDANELKYFFVLYYYQTIKKLFYVSSLVGLLVLHLLIEE